MTDPANPEPEVSARDLELAHAERDAALALVDGLERIITKAGGFMDSPDQHHLRAARAFLEERGLRPRPKIETWRNRP